MDDPKRTAPIPCDAIRVLLRHRTEGSLDEAGGGAVRDHLASCGACRSEALRDDPSVLFLELRGHDLPERFWTGFNEELRSRLGPRRLDWRLAFRGPRLAYVAAPLLMLLIVGAALFLRPGGDGWERSEGIRSPFLPPGQPLRPGVIAQGSASGPGAAMAPSGPVAGGAPDRAGILDGAAAPSLEEIGPPGARVYHFTVGTPGDETAIYLVVDESIDI